MRLRMWVWNALGSTKLAPAVLTATILASSMVLTGCGGSSTVADKPAAKPVGAGETGGATARASEESPEAIVSEFLDGVRRGGTAADVGRLMSTKSREQYAAVGLVMQPIGAPDATFEITRSVPYGTDGALVNSLWTEKDAAGETVTYQVGWALRKEAAGWRVSGLILDDDPAPRAFNFENEEDVLALKALQESFAPENEPTARTADGAAFDMPPL